MLNKWSKQFHTPEVKEDKYPAWRINLSTLFRCCLLCWKCCIALEQRSKFWLSVRPGQLKKSPDNQKYWCGCPTDNYNIFMSQLWNSTPATNGLPCPKYMDTQKLGRTTKNCSLLVVRGTTMYIIRTLLWSMILCYATAIMEYILSFGHNQTTTFWIMHPMQLLSAIATVRKYVRKE